MATHTTNFCLIIENLHKPYQSHLQPKCRPVVIFIYSIPKLIVFSLVNNSSYIDMIRVYLRQQCYLPNSICVVYSIYANKEIQNNILHISNLLSFMYTCTK